MIMFLSVVTLLLSSMISLTNSQPTNFYRFYCGTYYDHFYTASETEVDSLDGTCYSSEGNVGEIWPTQTSGTVKLYRYYCSTYVDHFYTTNWNELGSGSGCYTYEGVAGYIANGSNSVNTTECPQLQALHRYYASSVVGHFYTTNWDELGEGTSVYSYEGITGYTCVSPDDLEEYDNQLAQKNEKKYSVDINGASNKSNITMISFTMNTTLFWIICGIIISAVLLAICIKYICNNNEYQNIKQQQRQHQQQYHYQYQSI